MKPILRYFGGKALIAKKIVARMPAHKIYLEPYAGAASVLLKKQPVKVEIYNDVDAEVVNLFQILRCEQTTAQLIDKLLMTPFSRDEFARAHGHTEEPVERARRLIIRSYQGYTSAATLFGRTGFRVDHSGSGIRTWQRIHARLIAASQRLRQVMIENKPGIQLIDSVADKPDALIYVDPPYLMSEWNYLGENTSYRHLMSIEEHAELLAKLNVCKANVMISGYPSDLYNKALTNWNCHQFETKNRLHHPKIDCLWTNF